jgi:hypothetical protein
MMALIALAISVAFVFSLVVQVRAVTRLRTERTRPACR